MYVSIAKWPLHVLSVVLVWVNIHTCGVRLLLNGRQDVSNFSSRVNCCVGMYDVCSIILSLETAAEICVCYIKLLQCETLASLYLQKYNINVGRWHKIKWCSFEAIRVVKENRTSLSMHGHLNKMLCGQCAYVRNTNLS